MSDIIQAHLISRFYSKSSTPDELLWLLVLSNPVPASAFLMWVGSTIDTWQGMLSTTTSKSSQPELYALHTELLQIAETSLPKIKHQMRLGTL